MIPGLARVPLTQLAAAYGLSVRNCYNLLRRLRDKDISARGRCDWWLQNVPKAPLFLNVSRLMAAHADHFELKYPNRDEFTALCDRVEELEEELSALRRRNAVESHGTGMQSPIGAREKLRVVPNPRA